MRHIDRPMHRNMRTSAGDQMIQVLREVAFEDVGEMVSCSYPIDGGARWAGATHGEVCSWATRGAPELRSRLLGMMERIPLPDDYTRPELHRRRRRVRGDFGNELDIHAAYQGRCDRAWDRLHVEQVATEGNRLVHVCIDLAATVGVNAYDGLWRAAAAMRILEALVSMGKSIAISAYFGGHRTVAVPELPGNPHGDVLATVRLKDYGQPLREDILAAATVIPFFRQIMLTAPFSDRTGLRATSNHGYAISDYALKTDAAEKDAAMGGSTVVIGQAFSEDMAQRTVTKFLETYVRSDSKVEGYSAADQVINWR